MRQKLASAAQWVTLVKALTWRMCLQWARVRKNGATGATGAVEELSRGDADSL